MVGELKQKYQLENSKVRLELEHSKDEVVRLGCEIQHMANELSRLVSQIQSLEG